MCHISILTREYCRLCNSREILFGVYRIQQAGCKCDCNEQSEGNQSIVTWRVKLTITETHRWTRHQASFIQLQPHSLHKIHLQSHPVEFINSNHSQRRVFTYRRYACLSYFHSRKSKEKWIALQRYHAKKPCWYRDWLAGQWAQDLHCGHSHLIGHRSSSFPQKRRHMSRRICPSCMWGMRSRLQLQGLGILVCDAVGFRDEDLYHENGRTNFVRNMGAYHKSTWYNIPQDGNISQFCSIYRPTFQNSSN